MQAFSINLSPVVQAQITSFAQQYSVDPLVASAVAQVSSGGQQFNPDGSLIVTQFGVGVMGINKAVATALGLDATNQAQNIQAGVIALGALLSAFTGKYPFALAAYVTSIATVEQFNGIPPLAPVSNFVYNVSTIAANAGSTRVSALYKIRSDSAVDPSAPATQTGGLIDPDTTGINYGSGEYAATSADNLDQLQSSMSPILQRPDDTLSNTAWYADTGLITGNPRIRASVQPVKFSVYLDRNNPKHFLQNPQTGEMVEVQLNTSLISFEISSKHVYNRTPSRTGMHITLWGMEPDLISGSGTTGVFMNQFGLSDFMSTAGYNDDIKKLLTSGFRATFDKFQNPFSLNVAEQQATEDTNAFNLVSTVQQTPTGQVETGDLSLIPHLPADKIIARNATNPNEAFRVAAQDAFIEFLKLFQMNGSVWYHNEAYATGNDGKTPTNLGTIGNMEQHSPTAWSQKTGASSFQQHSRNNDVMTRGYVAMNYRNNVYLGYFKNLSWTQDAESPFQWKFNFTFQVEKTYTALYFPQAGVTVAQNFRQADTDTGQGTEQGTTSPPGTAVG